MLKTYNALNINNKQYNDYHRQCYLYSTLLIKELYKTIYFNLYCAQNEEYQQSKNSFFSIE